MKRLISSFFALVLTATILISTTMTAFAENLLVGFQTDANTGLTSYYEADGTMFTGTGFKNIDGTDYYFISGYLQNYNGIYAIDNINYYIQNGALVKYDGLINVNGSNALLSQGVGITAIHKESNQDIIYYENGLKSQKTGFVNEKNDKYYFKNGVAKKGLFTVNKKKYYASTSNAKIYLDKTVTIKKVKYVSSSTGVLHKKTKAANAAAARIKKITKSSDSKYTKLKKSYKWILTHCSYKIKRGYVQPSGSKWVNKYASNMYSSRNGRCYSFAAAFAVMAREIKYTNVNVVVGKCNGFTGGMIPHAWVEIEIDGKIMVFDPEYDYRHGRGFRNFNKPYSSLSTGYSISNKIKVNRY